MQLKRILSIFLAAALIFSVPFLQVGAESTETFEVGVVAMTTTPVSSSPDIYNAGDNVSVIVRADKNTGISLLKFTLNYNTEALEFIDYDSNNLFDNESITVASNYIVYNTMLNESSIATGVILTLNFKIKENYCGDTEIYSEVFGGRPANCKNDSSNVPFIAGKDSFTVHTVDVSAGVVTDPTCTEEGYTTYHCSLCDKDVVGNIVSAKGHTEADAVVENRVEPTCLENGSYDSVVYCSVCKAELSRKKEVIDALGHDLKHTEAKEPTCTEIGWKAYDTCQREGCGYTTYEEIAAHGHTESDAVVENRVEPTCIENGSYDSVVYCSVCKAELSRKKEVIDALGHDLKHTEAKDATCTEIGWKAYDTCQREGCGYTTYEEIAAKGHTEADAVVENKVEATCLENGSYDSVVYCSVCKAELSRKKEVIDALGHDLKHTEAKDATCTEIGWKAYDTCQREGCGYTTYEEIAAHGHTESDAVVENRVEPTRYETGSYDNVIYCSVCNEELSREVVVLDVLLHGWYTEDDQRVYYEDGIKLSNCWMKDTVGWVYLGEDGAMLTNAWCQDSQGWCYVGADGYAVTNCWKQDSIGWIWLNDSGSMTKNSWLFDNGNWYWLDANGYMAHDTWMQDSKGWVYLGSNGAMLTNAWCQDSQGWCYVGADGYAETNCWKQDSIGWIWLNDSGSMAKNSWLLDGGNWYYLDENGYMVTGSQIINGTRYNFNSKGIWVS